MADSYDAVAVNGKIYAIAGGYTFQFNPATDTWKSKTPMPTFRISYAIAAVNNKIYVIGGQTWSTNPDGSVSGKVTDIIEVYDVTTDTWETKQPLSQRRNDMDANVVDGKIHVIGGLGDGNFHEVYDPTTDTWTNSTPPPYSMSRYLSCVVDDKIYLIHDNNSHICSPTIEREGILHIYDTKTDSWSVGATIPTTYRGSGIAATTGLHAPKRIYVMGGGICRGFADIEAVSSNYIYDPVSDSWGNSTDMPTARSNPAVVAVNDKLYAIGGGLTSTSITGTPTDVVEVYTPFDYGVSSGYALNGAAATITDSIDDGENITIPSNVTSANSTNGEGTLTHTTPDGAGNGAVSETDRFTEVFPAILLAVTATTVTVIGIGRLVYFKKRKR